jgi:hypothetical protein
MTLNPFFSKEKAMNSVKTFLESRTVWANVIGLASLILTVKGVPVPDGVQERLVEAVLQSVTGVSFLASTIFRVVAEKRIGG